VLEVVSTQVPPHVIMPAPHPHEPPVQVAPPVHACPQLPQLSGSVLKSTQLLPHKCSVPVQFIAHDPVVHTIVAPHACPHEPQFAGSACVFTHVPLQLVRLGAHRHAPVEQTCDAAHIVVQPPQCMTSVFVSTHAPLQNRSGVGQRHVPVEHVCPAAHALPHEPQFCMSLEVSTHVPPQSVCPRPQSTSDRSVGTSRCTSPPSVPCTWSVPPSVETVPCGRAHDAQSTRKNHERGNEAMSHPLTNDARAQRDSKGS
jgi:hypothetical protein